MLHLGTWDRLIDGDCVTSTCYNTNLCHSRMIENKWHWAKTIYDQPELGLLSTIGQIKI